MKKGMALEGYIMPDKTIRPLKHYDDTKIKADIKTNKDDIDNLKSRVTYLETHGGAEDPTKADKVVEVTEGNFAGLDESGNLTDSEYAPSDFAPATHSHTIANVTDLSTVLAGKVDYAGNAYSINIVKESSAYPVSDERLQLSIQDFVSHVSAGKVVVCKIGYGTSVGSLTEVYGLAWWNEITSQQETMAIFVMLGSNLFQINNLQYSGDHIIDFENVSWTKTDLSSF